MIWFELHSTNQQLNKSTNSSGFHHRLHKLSQISSRDYPRKSVKSAFRITLSVFFTLSLQFIESFPNLDDLIVWMKLNPHISVDCVIFGFDGENLKALLLKRRYRISESSDEYAFDYKLPGDFITDEEDLDSAADRILLELTGLRDIYLRQFHVFGSPGRISQEHDLRWLRETTGLPVTRVVTVAYYSLIKIDESRRNQERRENAGWFAISGIHGLAFDHELILREGLRVLRRKLQYEPVGMQLLPEKFTIRQLQNLYEIIMGKELDNRNFRKKVLKADYLVALEEKEKGVAHKPARLFRFDPKVFTDSFNRFEGFQF